MLKTLISYFVSSTFSASLIVVSFTAKISFNPTLDKKYALELVKACQPETIDTTQKSIFDIKEEPKEIGLKGVSLGYTYFPRFS